MANVPMRVPIREGGARRQPPPTMGGPAVQGNPRFTGGGGRFAGGGGRTIGGMPLPRPMPVPPGRVVPPAMRNPVLPGQAAESDVDEDYAFGFPGKGPPGLMKKFADEPMRTGGMSVPFGGAKRFRAPGATGRSRTSSRKKIGRRNAAQSFGGF